MLIRQADPLADLDSIVYGAGEFARLVNRPDLFPDPGSAEMNGVVKKLMSVPGFVVLLAERDMRMVGAIGIFIGEYLMNIGKIECQEVFFWCAPDAPASAALALFRAARRLGFESGASIFTFHALLSSPAGIDKVYRRMGTEPIQTTYMGVADHE